MEFDKWFNSQSLLLKVLLLIIPIVSWITEILVRLSLVLRTKDTTHIVGLVLYLLLGWIMCVVDIVFLLVKGNLFLAE